MSQMKVQSVRFGPMQWRFVCAQADREGVSASQFVRDAAFGRAVLQWVATAKPEDLATMQSVLAGQPTAEDLRNLIQNVDKHYGPERTSARSSKRTSTE